MKEQEIYKTALEKFGIEAQIGQFHEEAGELMVAINKARRYFQRYKKQSQPLNLKVLKECADLEIMVEQIKIHFSKENIWDFENIKKGKLIKLKKYLNEE